MNQVIAKNHPEGFGASFLAIVAAEKGIVQRECYFCGRPSVKIAASWWQEKPLCKNRWMRRSK